MGQLNKILCFSAISFALYGNISNEISLNNSTEKTVQSIKPFTAKVAKKNVRLRVGASTESQIAKELQAGELLIVDGIKDGFYCVRPMSDMKAYVFRSFILDGQVEGNRVNVRLTPDLDSPVICQLNSGDKVEGVISSANSKWLEIPPPEAVHFYVAEEFLEKVGDEHYLAQMEKRKNQASRILNNAITMGTEELKKSFDEIQIQPVLALYSQIVDQYGEFQEHVDRAKVLSKKLSDDYLQVKIAYLEERAAVADQLAANQEWWTHHNESFASAIQPPIKEDVATVVSNTRSKFWQAIEQQYLDRWMAVTPNAEPEQFYEFQKEKSSKLCGVLEPYLRPVKNKPGDYVLMSRDKSPIAYLYSTEVNLAQNIGKELELVVVERPNNHFNHPAYFVLAVEPLDQR